MSWRTLLAVVLIVLGVIGIAYGGFSYTKEETVIDVGPFEARATTREIVPLPPVLGGVSLASGLILLLVPRRHRV